MKGGRRDPAVTTDPRIAQNRGTTGCLTFR